MSRVSFLRHSGFVQPSLLKDTVNIIGCGAVGSHVAVFAARMGWTNFSLWDADIVESHNLPNQTYNVRDIGRKKVEALSEVLTTFNPDIKIETHDEFLTADNASGLKGPMVIATDTMKSRSEFTRIFGHNLDIPIVLEARLAFDYGEIHTIDPLNPSHLDLWRKSLKLDSEIPDGPCNLRLCTTLVGVVSSTLVHRLCSHYAVRRGGREYSIPFHTKVYMRDNLVVRDRIDN